MDISMYAIFPLTIIDNNRYNHTQEHILTTMTQKLNFSIAQSFLCKLFASEVTSHTTLLDKHHSYEVHADSTLFMGSM